MQNMKDQIQDKEMYCDELQAKLNLMKDEKMVLTQSKDMLQKKLDDIYDNHILIDKVGGSSTASSAEKHQEEKKKEESEYENNITNEIRKLHF